MELMFMLKVTGHHGIPDGEWESHQVIEDDQDATVKEGVLLAVRAEIQRWFRGKASPDYLQNIVVQFTPYHTFYTLEGANEREHYIEVTITPVLASKGRFFALTEVGCSSSD